MKSINSKTHSLVIFPSSGNIGPLYKGFGFKDDIISSVLFNFSSFNEV